MRYLAVMLALVLAGCASAPPPSPPADSAPDLRGSWNGTWGGEPLTLLLTEQTIAPGDSGLVLGPWQVLGQRYPTVVGTLTCTIRGERVSTHVEGLISGTGGALVLALRARSTAGDQRITLRLIDRDRLQGSGESQYRWGPQGAAQLTRVR